MASKHEHSSNSSSSISSAAADAVAVADAIDAADPPYEFICPITQEIFKDPVVAADGNTYERDAIARWVRTNSTSPLTNLPLSSIDLIPNLNMKKLIADFVQAATAAAAATSAAAAAANAQTPGAASAETGNPTSLIQLARHFRDLDPIREQLAKTLDGWEPPVIVVIGDESSGKSTILERLAWMPLFPKGENLCTRLPILVSLRCSAQPLPPTLRVMEGDRVVSERQFDSPDCQEVVRSTMLQVIKNENKRVSGVSRSKQLHLQLSGPRLPNLDFLDVPGLVVNAKGDEPETIRQDTNGLVDDVIRRYKDRAVFLAVRSIRDEWRMSHTVVALNKNKDILERTLGVFTKCDRGFPDDIRRMLAEPGVDLGYGYVATMNKKAAGLTEQDAKEKKFFKQQGLEDLVQSKQATSHVLVERIEDLYVKYLAREWVPKTLQLLDDKKRELERKDQEMGLPRGHASVSPELAAKVAQAAAAVVAAARDGQVQRGIREIVIPLKASMMKIVEEAGKEWVSIVEFDAICARALSDLKRRVRKAAEDLVRSMGREIEAGLRSDGSPVRVSRFPLFIDGLVQKLAMTFDPHVATLQKRAVKALKEKFALLVEPELNLEEGKARLRAGSKQRIADVVCHCLVSYSASIASLGVEDVGGLAATLLAVETCRDARVAMLGEMRTVDTLRRKLAAMRVVPTAVAAVMPVPPAAAAAVMPVAPPAATEQDWTALAGVIGSDAAAKLRDGTTTKLDLTGKKIGDAGVAVLVKVLPECTALTKLDLDKNEISDAGVATLAQVLPQCRALQTLFLLNNQIGPAGALALSAVLPQCAALKTLGLSSNQIGEAGAVALSAVLPQCAALEYLDLSSNGIGEAGAVALSAVLPQCAALSILRLDSNGIGEAGAVALSAVLPQCAALSILRLNSNGIGDSGALALSAVLPQCAALSGLGLSSNGIGDSGAVALSAVLPQCAALQKLYLHSNQIGSSVKSKLSNMHNTVRNTNGNTIEIYS